MEFLQEPEVKSTYEHCKFKVKYWEHQFKKKHGRPPSKLDIREADKEIRIAYKTYFNLKSAAIEKSFQDIEGFNSDEETPTTTISTPNISAILNSTNDLSINLSSTEISPNETLYVSNIENANTDNTWGTHLNNPKLSKVEEKEEKPTVNASFSQKLFKNSSFSKRNPRKSLSFHHRKSETNLNSSKFLSQPSSEPQSALSETAKIQFDDLSSYSYSDKIKFTTFIEPTHAKSINIIHSVLESDFKSNRNIDPGWMQRVAEKTGTQLINKNINESDFELSQKIGSTPDEDSDDVIDSDEDDRMHILKKQRIESILQPRLDFSNIFNKIDGKKEEVEEKNKNEIKEKEKIIENNVDMEKKEQKISKNNILVEEKELDKKVQKNTKTLAKKKQIENIPERKSRRPSKKILDLQPEEPEDPFENTEDEDPDFDPNNTQRKSSERVEEGEEQLPEKKKGKNAVLSKKSAKSKSEIEEDPNEESGQYELEYSVKPRIVSVPRNPNLKNVIRKRVSSKKIKEVKNNEIGVVVKGKEEQKAEKLQKKIEAGNLNENFVRIDLKKKIYARGKKTMTFSKYKKKLWKQKKKSLAGPDMDMGGCDGGALTCFTCGQVGHFAQNCKATKGDKLLPLAAVDEEYCPFPTLEEASEMAQGSVLAIRQPKNRTEITEGEETTSEHEEEEEKNEQNEDDPFGDDEDEDLLVEALKLEEYVKKIDMQQYIDESKLIKPYFSLNDDGSIIETPREVYEVLNLFGHSKFRPGQERAIMRILSGLSTLVTLSTGSGKSLCYQIPAYLYAKREPSIALVISPLVSLMEDQVTGVPSFLKAACLHTNKTKIQREKIMQAISEGSLDILLVSPEAVVAGEKSNGFGSLLRKLPPISFACIDEAHCVSQWSHNFRPSYLMLCRILKERLGVCTILGLTATSTRATSDSIINHLAIPDGHDGIISDTPLPDNLRLTISRDGNRDQALLNLLLSDTFSNFKSIIVYCIRRTECERIASFLRTSLKVENPTEMDSKKRKKLNVQAEPYHAGLSASRRRTIQNKFMKGELRIVVATVAFGMGINKSDIRAVIHYNLPKNFESYVQEVGRAGRDGLPAHCHLFLDSQGKDENELRRHIFSDSLDRHVIRKLLQKIFIPCSCKLKCPKHEVAFSIQETVLALDLPEENISTLLCYLELHSERYIELLSPAYTTCKIISYGGNGNAIRKAAKDCPPLAMALAMFGNKEEDSNTFEFPVVDVAAAMGWDSGICKHKLKNLEWTNENNQPKRSLLTIQFSNLGFRLLAPGNLTDVQLDETLDSLYQRIVDQENTALLQLHALHDAVISAASPTYRFCITQDPTEKEIKLKSAIRSYFDSPEPLKLISLKKKKINEDVIINDIRAIISMYRDNNFTGRAIARIFFGIESPNYRAVIWGRCKFWRAHLNSDFNEICRLATKEILKLRNV